MNAQTFLSKKKISIADNGFTMIEVLMAMTIFLIGFLAVGSMQIASVNGNTSARMRTSASILAADIVEQLMRCPYDSSSCTLTRDNQTDGEQYFDNDPLSIGRHPDPGWYTDDPDGDGPDQEYDVCWVVANGPDPNSKQIDVFVRWQRGVKNNSVQYSFLAADADL